MKRRKITSFIAAISLGIMMFSMPVLAADGVAADGPQGAIGAANPSSGAATVNSSDGTTFTTNGDDDNLAEAADVGGKADINVYGKVLDASTKIYKIDIGWGAMQFEFNKGSGQWSTSTHTYVGGSTAGWTAVSVNGTNNKITVTNHSNGAVDASFAYVMEPGAFNQNATGDDHVAGNFFADNTKATTAAGVLKNTDTAVSATLTDNKVLLETADKYSTDGTSGTNVDAGARPKEVFFAFSGTPDENSALTNYTKVGTITVTIAPNAVRQAEYKPYVQ